MSNQTSNDKYEPIRKALAMGRPYLEGCSIFNLFCGVGCFGGQVRFTVHRDSTDESPISLICGCSYHPEPSSGTEHETSAMLSCINAIADNVYTDYRKAEPFARDCDRDPRGFLKRFEQVFDAIEACGGTVELGDCNEVSFNIRIYWKGKKSQ